MPPRTVTCFMDSALPEDSRPLIVTARLDRVSQTYFNGLREQHFPPERNYLPAHLTMFHALPGDAIENVSVLLTHLAESTPSPHATVSGLRSLGNGVAFTICSPGLERIRREIAAAFEGKLTRQDSQRWSPHITVQNKVSRESAAGLMAKLQGTVQPWTVSVEALDLWRYDGGPWEIVRGFPFGVVT